VFLVPRVTKELLDPREALAYKDLEARPESPEKLESPEKSDLRAKMVPMEKRATLEHPVPRVHPDFRAREANLVSMEVQDPRDPRA